MLARAAVFALLVLFGGSAVAETLQELIVRHRFAPEDVGVLVETMDGRRVIAHRVDEPGLPASTLKLVTALGALDHFGPSHRFVTRLLTTGSVDSRGALHGNVVLEGGGDPLLDLDGLMSLALALRARGVREATGSLIVDDSAMPVLAMINPEQPVEAGYNAGVGALSLAFNRVERRPLADGGWLTVPPMVERGPAWTRLPFDAPAAIPVRDPGLHAGNVFKSLAVSLGIALPDPARGSRPANAVVLAEVASRTLRDIIQAMLLYSNNQVAEIIGLAATGEASLGLSARAMAEPIRRELSDIDWRDFVITNHSGLDPKARATPAQLLGVLRLAEERHGILALLPAAAWSGSLASRFRHVDAALRVWAKTGSLDFATALVGYVLPRNGEPLRIAVLIADAASRRQRDAVEAPPPEMQRAIDDFEVRARGLRDAVAMLALEPR